MYFMCTLAITLTVDYDDKHLPLPYNSIVNRLSASRHTAEDPKSDSVVIVAA